MVTDELVNEEIPASARVSTTLAVNTRETPQTCCVDWVTCSFVFRCDIEKVLNLIGISDLDNLEEKKGARYEFAGYNVTYKLGHLEIMHYKDDVGQCHWLLNFSGQGCRQFEISSVFDFKTLFAILANLDVIYTRLDIAIDDFKNIFSVNQFRKAVFNKQCVTRLRVWGDHRRGLIATGLDDIIMDNFYLGSNNSRYFLNVYDKKLEREQKNIELDKSIVEWTRTEVRLSYEFADMFVMHIVEDEKDIGYLIKSFLNEKITFLKPSALKLDSNRSRLAKQVSNHAEWWRTFLNATGRLHLTVYKPEKTLRESKDWLLNQVSTTLAMWHMYKPEQYGELIQQLTHDGLTKLKDKHERKIKNQIYLDNLEQKKKLAASKGNKFTSFDI